MPDRPGHHHRPRFPAAVIAHAVWLYYRFGLSLRIEQSHQPTRVRKRQMRRFKSVPSAQRFLVVFSRFCNHFRPRRYLLTAAEYRVDRHARYAGWRDLVGRAA
jgi:transposase-like protein